MKVKAITKIQCYEITQPPVVVQASQIVDIILEEGCNKHMAIKHVRRAFSIGLREAKDMVETVAYDYCIVYASDWV